MALTQIFSLSFSLLIFFFFVVVVVVVVEFEETWCRKHQFYTTGLDFFRTGLMSRGLWGFPHLVLADRKPNRRHASFFAPGFFFCLCKQLGKMTTFCSIFDILGSKVENKTGQ